MNNNDENFDFIKQQFDNENINAPATLGEAQVLSKILNNEDQERIISVEKSAASKKRKVRGGIAIAAAVAIVIGAAFSYPYFKDEVIPQPIEKVGTIEDGGIELAHFDSHAEINSLLNRMFAKDHFRNGILKKGMDFAVEDAEMEAAEGGMGGGDGAAQDFGTTYKQVEAVDEADVLKTDGTYIYHINNNAIQVYAANDGEPYWVCSIDNPAFSSDYYEESDERDYSYAYSYISDFYVNNGRLIAISQESNGDYTSSNECTLVQVFDISEIDDVQLIDEYRQSGYYSSSRMIGESVYLVTNHYVGAGNKDFYIPYCGVGEGQNSLDAQSIYKTASPSDACYLVLGAIDISQGVKNTDAKAIFGASSTVYCNEDNMFITNTVGSYTYYNGYNSEYEGKIQIIKARLSSDKIEFTAAGFVDGYVNDQFSMDEKDGCLRIATTSYSFEGEGVQTNNLFILDESLKVIGSVKGFADDESIRAVRFIGDTAYVITYEYVDPLFIIDLSDKENPQIKGSVEIDGFSSLLAPIDEGRILGVGYATYEGEYGMVSNGLKIVLFDISDPENPQVLDSAEFYDTDSEAQYNHKALVQNRAQGYFAMPVSRSYSVEAEDGYYEYYDEGSGVITVEADGDALNITNDFMVDDSEAEYNCSPRCTYIGSYVYFIDRTGTIYAFDYAATAEAVG